MPPDGPVTFVASWLENGVAKTSADLDGAAIREAARRAVILFRRAGLARAGLRWRELAFSLVRPYAAVTGLSDCGDGKEKVYGSIP